MQIGRKLRCILGLHDWDITQTWSWSDGKETLREERFCSTCDKLDSVSERVVRDETYTSESG